MREDADILISGVTILSLEGRPLEGVDIAIRGGFIHSIGRGLKVDAADTIDGEGKIAIPGLVDCHTHSFQVLLRGALTLKELQRHPVWLKVLIPFEAEMSREEAMVSAQLSCLNSIKKGVTAIADAGGPYPELLAEAALESGLRALVTYSTMDAGPENYRIGVERNRDLVRKYREGRVRGYYSIRQIMTSTDDLIERTFRYASEDNVPVQMHLSEEVLEIQHSLSRWGLRPAEYLHRKGFLKPALMAAHCAFLSQEECIFLARSGATVVHCPTIAMMYMNFPPIPEIMIHGGNVALGSDGGGLRPLDLFSEMSVMLAGMAGYYGTPYHHTGPLTPLKALEMATRNGAKHFASMLGDVAAGLRADIALINAKASHLTPLHDPYSLPLFATGSDVSDLIIDGKIVMRQREVLTINEEDILQRAREVLPDVRERVARIVRK
jgi:5-methylthioadenosine/S-adenosylhomocysteine deaminase